MDRSVGRRCGHSAALFLDKGIFWKRKGPIGSAASRNPALGGPLLHDRKTRPPLCRNTVFTLHPLVSIMRGGADQPGKIPSVLMARCNASGFGPGNLDGLNASINQRLRISIGGHPAGRTDSPLFLRRLESLHSRFCRVCRRFHSLRPVALADGAATI